MISPNNWYHVGYQVASNAGVCTGSLWINGIHRTVNFTVTPSTASADAVNVRIGSAGATADGAQLPFKGYIDEVSMWNTSFTQAQWSEIYNGGVPMDATLHTAAVSKKLNHYYRMGDNDTYSTINDLTGSSNGTMTNMAASNFTSSVPTAWSNAYSINFDGTDDHVVVGQPADVVGINHTTTARTYSMWARLNAAVADATFLSVAEQTNRPIQIYTVSGLPTVYLGTNQMQYGVAMTNGTWYHICVTNSSAGAAKLYVDGVQRATTTAGSAAQAYDLLFGARRNSLNTGTAWMGACNVDEITIWDTEFTLAEVKQLTGSNVTSKPIYPELHFRAANLKHYWKMGDGDIYPILQNLKSAFNSGTMTSAASDDIEVQVP